MNRKNKVRIVAGGVEGFFERSLDRARRLDRGEELPPEIVVSFEDPGDMLRVLTAERIRLLGAAKRKATPISVLAGSLQRDTRAVKRDVAMLERYGLLRTRYETNPAHGRRKVVEARAARYQLVATI
jgi:predicted transcriptional regulator